MNWRRFHNTVGATATTGSLYSELASLEDDRVSERAMSPEHSCPAVGVIEMVMVAFG